MKFAIRSNCMAHGRIRHNRSFKPVVIDISHGEEIELEEECEEDEEIEDEFQEVHPKKVNSQ